VSTVVVTSPGQFAGLLSLWASLDAAEHVAALYAAVRDERTAEALAAAEALVAAAIPDDDEWPRATVDVDGADIVLRPGTAPGELRLSAAYAELPGLPRPERAYGVRVTVDYGRASVVQRGRVEAIAAAYRGTGLATLEDCTRGDRP